MNITFLLPMKGHSERVKNKNLRLISGKPLYFHLLSKLLKSKHLDNVIINTDSELITQSINKYFSNDKIIIHKRPKNLHGDHVSMNKIIDYDVKKSNKDYFFQTHSTNPLLKTSTIDQAIESYFKNLKKYDSLFSVNKYQSRFFNSHFEPINHDLKSLIRTQDLKPVYEENSNIYIFSKSSFYNSKKNRIGVNPYLYEMDLIESIDIDTEKEFYLADKLIQINDK